MKNYVLAELLKIKRSSLPKIIFIIPILSVPITVGFNYMGGEESIKFNIETIVNHWALIWLPISLTILAGSLNELEKKNTQYKSIFSLNINLLKKEISRIILISLLIFVSTIFLSCILSAIRFFGGITPVNTTLLSCIMGLFICFIVNIWQIPLWLWLSRKANMYVCLILNVALSLELGTRFAAGNRWFLVPWSWGLHVQSFFTQLYPNGLPLPQNIHITNNLEIIEIIILSVSLYCLFLWIAGKSFEKKEIYA